MRILIHFFFSPSTPVPFSLAQFDRSKPKKRFRSERWREKKKVRSSSHTWSIHSCFHFVASSSNPHSNSREKWRESQKIVFTKFLQRKKWRKSANIWENLFFLPPTNPLETSRQKGSGEDGGKRALFPIMENMSLLVLFVSLTVGPWASPPPPPPLVIRSRLRQVAMMAFPPSSSFSSSSPFISRKKVSREQGRGCMGKRERGGGRSGDLRFLSV